MKFYKNLYNKITFLLFFSIFLCGHAHALNLDEQIQQAEKANMTVLCISKKSSPEHTLSAEEAVIAVRSTGLNGGNNLHVAGYFYKLPVQNYNVNDLDIKSSFHYSKVDKKFSGSRLGSKNQLKQIHERASNQLEWGELLSFWIYNTLRLNDKQAADIEQIEVSDYSNSMTELFLFTLQNNQGVVLYKGYHFSDMKISPPDEAYGECNIK